MFPLPLIDGGGGILSGVIKSYCSRWFVDGVVAAVAVNLRFRAIIKRNDTPVGIKF